MEQAALAVVVVDREVPGRAVVPEGERAFAPVEAAGEFRPDRVPIEILEQWSRFLLAPAIETQGETRVDVERLAAGLRVANDDRMNGVLCRQLGVADAALEVAAPGLGRGAKDMAARVQCFQPMEGRLQPFGAGVVGGGHGCEQSGR